MIKRIIFDLDDTLMVSDEIFSKCIKKGLQEEGYSLKGNIVEKIDNFFEEYERTHQYYDYEEVAVSFNKRNKMQITTQTLKRIDEILVNEFPGKVMENIPKILEYLSSKYELVVLTNYFYDVQVERLKRTNLKKYFKKIFAGDKIPCKPYPESYKLAAENNLYEQCLVIGDNILNDYLKPLELGMQAILFDKTGKYKEKEYQKISNMKELMKLL